MVDMHIDDTRVTELIVHFQIPHIDGACIHVDRVGECIVCIGVFYSQATVFHISVSLDCKRFEGTMQVDVSEPASLNILGYLVDKRMEESNVEVVRVEEQG